MYFQDLVLALQEYWSHQNCLVVQPYDVEKGAGTFNPATFLRSLGPEPFNAAYVEPCRRPTDGRYGDNPIRLQHYYQFQVVMKPNPENLVELYLESLAKIGISTDDHDVRFVHDDWESPTLGAWGLGWEVWADGMEITQYTYFQQVGGIELSPVMGEITYGLERICMFLQNVDNVYELQYNSQFTYGDLFHQNEVFGSLHNFEQADISLHLDLFKRYEMECSSLCDFGNPVAAVDYCLKASHAFNLLDARGAISVSERQGYILRVRTLARRVAECWLVSREELGYPLLKKDVGASPAGSEGKVPTRPSTITDVDSGSVSPLLIEVGVEEMPAKVFSGLATDLLRLIKKQFGAVELNFEDTRIFTTPRRITISINSVRLKQADRTETIKGPPMRIAKDDGGDWTKAAIGFAKKNGVPVDDLETSEIEGTDYVTAVITRHGRMAAELIAESLPEILVKIPWYKTMKWGRGEDRFVRPVKWIAAVLGNQVLNTGFAGIEAGCQSYGHRFMAPEAIALSSDREAYLECMRDVFVIADDREREGLIRNSITEIADKAGLQWKADEELLNEVNYLVEYPVPVCCRFDERYLSIPDVVLISEMKKHQKYFALHDRKGELNNSFVVISNATCTDPDVLRNGYERVLRSRFADAEFFLAEDLKIKLADRTTRLKQQIFQEQLGSVYEKVQRVKALVSYLSDVLEMGETCRQQAVEIVDLCKADLNTSMVGEFPDLQGAIGQYYAAQQGHSAVVANGILGHYLPRSVTDALPESDEAAMVGIADRIDTLVGIFAIGKAPTGSADPYALRRACLTSIVLIISREFRIDISELITTAIAGYSTALPDLDTKDLQSSVLDFYLARATGLFHDDSRPDFPGNFRLDSIHATTDASVSWYDLHDLVLRIKALEMFRQRADFDDVAATFKRANNIIRNEENVSDVRTDLFDQPEESELWEAVLATAKVIEEKLNAKDYLGALAAIAPLRSAVNAFFDAVLVNDPDTELRDNRRGIVARVVHLVRQMADFSRLQVD